MTTDTPAAPLWFLRFPGPVLLAVAAFAVVGLGGSSIRPAAAGPLHAEWQAFFPTGKYVLYISGKPQTKARILHSRKAGAFLVMDSDYGKALLIEPKTKRVSAIAQDEVAEGPDKGLDVIEHAKIERLGTIRRDRGDVVINVEGLVARLHPQAYLIGLKKADDLVLHTPEYERNGRRYKVGKNEISKLEESGKVAVVRVYFGSWCHTCSRLLPRILKVEKALEGTKIQFEYYGLPKGAKAMARDPLAHRNNIRRIPTGLVTIDGRAAGRINSTAFGRPELALCRLVLKN